MGEEEGVRRILCATIKRAICDASVNTNSQPPAKR